MPSVTTGRAYIQYGPVAVRAARTEQVVVVRLAVRVTVPLKEVAGAEFLLAVGADEVLRVPGLAERRDHLTHDRLVASAAAALLRCVNSLQTLVEQGFSPSRNQLDELTVRRVLI